MPETTTETLTWKDKLQKMWWGVKIADNALQVDKDDRRQRVNERLIRKTQDKLLGPDTEAEKGEEVGIRVGDDNSTHVYNYPAKKKTSLLAKGVVGAGLIATGWGLGIGAPMVLDAMKGDTPVVVPKGEDSDTLFRIEAPMELLKPK